MIVLTSIALGVAVTSLLLVVSVGDSYPQRGSVLARGALSELAAHLRDRREAAAAGARSLDVLQATSAALRSGAPLSIALRQALEGHGTVMRDPYRRALRAFELNADLHEELRAAGHATSDRRVQLGLEALALVAAEQLPAVRAAAIVASVADRLAFDLRLAEEVRARTSGVRAQIVLLALLVPALALYLVLSLPGLAGTLGSPLGLFVLVPAAAVFEIAGIVASRAIVRGLHA